MKWLAVKNRRVIGILVPALLISILIASLLLACGSPQENGGNGGNGGSGAIRITLVSGWTDPDTGNDKLHEYVDKINAAGKGKVYIDFLGGAEVAPITENVGLVRDYVFDMVLNAPGYYAGLCQESLMLHYSTVSTAILNESGATEMMDEVHREKMGITILGFIWRGENFTILSKEPITSADFKGYLFHSLPIFTAPLTYLGAATTFLTVSEFYIAMERGVVDAIPLPLGSVPYEQALYEVCDYMLYPKLPIMTAGPLMINEALWNSLPADVQTLMSDTLLDMEDEVYDYYHVGVMNEFEQKLQDKGLERVDLPAAEGEKLVHAFTEFAWDDFFRENREWAPKYFDLISPYLEWTQ